MYKNERNAHADVYRGVIVCADSVTYGYTFCRAAKHSRFRVFALLLNIYIEGGLSNQSG